MNRSSHLFALLAAGMLPGVSARSPKQEPPRPLSTARECARRDSQRATLELSRKAKAIDAGGSR